MEDDRDLLYEIKAKLIVKKSGIKFFPKTKYLESERTNLGKRILFPLREYRSSILYFWHSYNGAVENRIE